MSFELDSTKFMKENVTCSEDHSFSREVSGLKVFYANARSIKSDVQKEMFMTHISGYVNGFDVLVITETWCNATNVTNFPEYNGCHAFCTSKERSGGVSIYVRDYFIIEQKYSESLDGNEFLIVNISNLSSENRGMNLNIFGVYRKPTKTSESMDSFYKSFDAILKLDDLKLNPPESKMSPMIILGDFNIDRLKRITRSDKYGKIIKDNQFVFLNEFIYTRKHITTNTTTLIDHVLTNIFNHDHKLLIVKDDRRFSDHRNMLLNISFDINTRTLGDKNPLKERENLKSKLMNWFEGILQKLKSCASTTDSMEEFYLDKINQLYIIFTSPYYDSFTDKYRKELEICHRKCLKVTYKNIILILLKSYIQLESRSWRIVIKKFKLKNQIKSKA